MTDLTREHRRQLPSKDDGTSYSFMIVDDSEFMVNNLKRILVSFGGRVLVAAADGLQAVVDYESMDPKPDIVTMDITMPKMGGIEAIKEILARNPAQKIVVVSAMGHKDIIRQAIVLGAKYFIVKPFVRDDIYRVVRKILDLKIGSEEEGDVA